ASRVERSTPTTSRGSFRFIRQPLLRHHRRACASSSNRGASPLELPHTLSREPPCRLAPFAWLASLRSLASGLRATRYGETAPWHSWNPALPCLDVRCPYRSQTISRCWRFFS